MSANYCQSIAKYLNPDCLNPDTARMCRADLKELGISMPLINDLFKLSFKLIKQSNPELNKKLKTLQADMATYFNQRQATDTPLHDLIFEIQELAKLQLSEAKGTLLREIDHSDSPLKDNPLKDALFIAIERENYTEVSKIINKINKG